jgi:hypothetical protein
MVRPPEKNPMIYLASPYSHDVSAVREMRFRRACWATAELMKRGENVFSPIVHSHPLVVHGLPNTWEFWQRVDRDYLEHCEQLVVLMLDGWRESVGVQAEIAIAREFHLPIEFLDPVSLSFFQENV